MKINHAFIARWVICILATLSLGHANAREKCTAFAPHFSCQYVVTSKQAHLYESPNVKSRVMYTYPFLGYVTVDVPEITNGQINWLPVLHDDTTKGWIEGARIVSLQSFKRVTSCWPIKTIRGKFAEIGFTAQFSLDGEGEVRGLEEANPERKIQAYTWKNLILISFQKKQSFMMIGHIDVAGKIYFRDAEISQQILFDLKALNDCTSRSQSKGPG